MLRLTLLVLLACLIGIAVSYPTNDESSSDDHSNDQTQSSDDDSQSDDHSSDDSQDSADSSQETDNGLDLRNGTCLEKAERILKYLWEQYKLKHNINISPDEEKMRIAIFKELLERIQLQNGKAEMGQSTFEIGINAFSHLTPEEVNKMKGFISDQKRSSRNEFRASTPLPALPSSLDWRQYGWVTPVKNQGQCGSCYTFATTGCLEGQLFNRTNQLVSMSEQNLVDCSRGKRGTPNLGCNGGITDVAFEYVMKNGGIATEASYPYTAKLGKCKYATSMSAGGPNVIGFVDVQSGSEAALQQAVALIGPTTVAIDASSPNFQSYKSGIYQCTTQPNLDHAVLVVGYTPTYWIVKNSWGTSWGQQGYIYMARGNGNVANCGITSQASVAYMQ